MEARAIAAIILAPFALAFVYAAVHEFLRYKSDGRANYGLVYDEENGTTHVSGIADDEEAYDPDDFDPSSYQNPNVRQDVDTKDGQTIGLGR
ncbi:hypothetical protein [uncultured Jannaschia sp.]|uniref:hypothetical protein n=1 Tax=uncultured Jannaschia sp. TaxID=293347 RepID=UPI0026112296|nr:hypothetical protein [uncultured Jannaschia sp.]